jgi:DNA-binding NtrC family response regulator
VKTAPTTILIVDDEASIRNFVHTALLEFGYEDVLEAGDAERAVDIVEKSGKPIHLLLSDIMLGGGATGIDLARTITDSQPDTKVLLMSGYPNQPIELKPGWQFIPKPFVPSQLLTMVQRILDTPGKTQLS